MSTSHLTQAEVRAELERAQSEIDRLQSDVDALTARLARYIARDVTAALSPALAVAWRCPTCGTTGAVHADGTVDRIAVTLSVGEGGT